MPASASTVEMTREEILHQRMHNQGLVASHFGSPGEAIETLGAVQAQDFLNSKWGIGLRVHGADDARVTHAFDKGKILRTHVMRPTWHFVSPKDIRWMQELTGSRVMRLVETYNRRLGLDETLFAKTNQIIERILKGENFLTRQEMHAEMKKAGMHFDVQKLAHVVMQAELRGLICSGPLKGKQITYGLVEERAPQSKSLPREKALEELVRRYYTTHGPATVKDFVWWSGLTVKDTMQGLHSLEKKIPSFELQGQRFYYSPKQKKSKVDPAQMYLLPNYDEYTIGYISKHALYLPPNQTISFGIGFFHALMQNGMVLGTWKRAQQKNHFAVQTKFMAPPSSQQKEALHEAIDKFGQFFQKEARLAR